MRRRSLSTIFLIVSSQLSLMGCAWAEDENPPISCSIKLQIDSNGTANFVKINATKCASSNRTFKDALSNRMAYVVRKIDPQSIRGVAVSGPSGAENRKAILSAWEYSCRLAGNQSSKAKARDFLHEYKKSSLLKVVAEALEENGLNLTNVTIDNFYPVTNAQKALNAKHCDGKLMPPVIWFE